MASNVLLLNCDKMKMLVLGPKEQRDLLFDPTINLDGCTVFSNKTVGPQRYSRPHLCNIATQISTICTSVTAANHCDGNVTFIIYCTV
jgi:hypothetical protein